MSPFMAIIFLGIMLGAFGCVIAIIRGKRDCALWTLPCCC